MATLALKAQKIGILGLANAGKTSLLKVLAQQFSSLTSIKPTQGVERTALEFLGLDLVMWDFGGQSRYREKYLDNPQRYFEGISHLFYVVDLQDPNAVKESCDYFQNIIPPMKTYSPDAKYIIIFHKADPNYQGLFDIAQIKQNFLDGVAEIVTKNEISISMYQTSIFSPMTVITAFSQPLLENQEIYQKISGGLGTFTQSQNVSFTVLFTKKFLEIGHYNHETVPVERISLIIKEFFERYDPTAPPNRIDAFDIQSHRIFVQKFFLPVYNTNFVFYITTGYEKSKKIDETKLQTEISHLQENLIKILMNVDLFGLEHEIKTRNQ
jgi:GTPase SAR1 family protein